MIDQENVELEQVPLKSDTDSPAVYDGRKDEENEDGKKQKHLDDRKFPFFGKGWRNKKKEYDDTGRPVCGITENETTIKPKKATLKDWFLKKTNDGSDLTDDEKMKDTKMSIRINLLDRDERAINEHVKLSFEDIYGEPDTTHSWDCVWCITHHVFNCSRCFFYRLFALFLAVPSAILFGLLFALLTVVNIFACVPCGRALTIPATWIAKTWNFVVRSLFDPCFRSCGLCLSSVAVRRYSMSSDTTADLNLV